MPTYTRKGTLLLCAIILVVSLCSAAPARSVQSDPLVQSIPVRQTGPLPSSLSASQPPPHQPDLRLHGQVTDAQGQPIVNATVEAVLPGGRVAGLAITGPGGHYTFSPLPPAPYRLRVRDALGRPLPLVDENSAAVQSREGRQAVAHHLVVLALPTEPGEEVVSPHGLPLIPPEPGAPPPEAPLIPSLPPAAPAPERAPGAIQASGQITGVVTAGDSGLPLQSVYVTAYQLDGTYVNYAYTNSAGLYNLTGLDTGDYKVSFTYYGSDYLPEWYDDQRDEDDADPVSVTDGAITPNIDAALEKGGQIAGQVTAADSGMPLQDVSVTAYDQNGGYISNDYTDASGVYTITQLASGSYRLKFNPASWGGSADYLAEFYDDQPDLESADPIQVNAPAVVRSIDAVLARGGKISGQVTAADTGLPLPDVSVYAYDADGDYVGSDSVDANGVYTLTQLTSGAYRLKFTPNYWGASADYIAEFYDDQPDLASANPVQVNAPGVVHGIDAVLARGGKISGQVTAADTGLPLPDVSVYAYDADGDYAGSDSVDVNGVYTLTQLITGTYRLWFYPYGNSDDYLPEYYDNKTSLATADLVQVNAPAVVRGIDAVLARGGKISGQVTAAGGGMPLEDVYVTAYDQNGDEASYALTDASGIYTINQLISGTYRVGFEPASWGASADYLPEFYDDQPDFASADPISLAAPQVVTGIDAALALGGKISGKVTAADSGAPLEDVEVEVYDQSGNWIGYDWTDASGVYTVTQLASGDYRLSFYPQGDYLQEYYDNKPDLVTADPVHLIAPNVVTGIDAALSPGAKLSGQVTAADTGAPLEDVSIDVYDCNGFSVGWATTNAGGVYTTTALETGTYRLGFWPQSYGMSRSYLSEYYNNRASLETAVLIDVTAPQTITGIDAALARGGQIAGQVTAADGGAPLDDVSVTVYDSQGYYVDSVYTNASGVYTTTGLVSGSYRLAFEPDRYSPSADYAFEYYNDRTSWENADPISVAAPQVVTGIDAALARGGKISGQITALDTGLPIGDAWVDVYNSAGDYIKYSSTDNAGAYTIPGLPSGSYRLIFTPYGSDQDYIQEYYNDKARWGEADLVELVAPNAVVGIDAALARGGKILCNVTAEDTGLPLYDVYVEAYDPDLDYWSYDYSDTMGDCTLAGLPSGSYRVYFDEVTLYSCSVPSKTYAWEYYDDKPDFASADVVPVTAPGTVSDINAQLSAGTAPPHLTTEIYLPLVVR